MTREEAKAELTCILNHEGEYMEYLTESEVEAIKTLAVERPRGEWIENKKYNRRGKRFLNCSVCHYGDNGDIVCNVSVVPNFCPNCGADMRR